MPPADDYVDACAYGRECAAHLAQYLKDNPDRHSKGLLGKIAMVLGALRCDVFQHVDSVHALQRALIAKTELEGKTPGRNS
ncbi:MULTISPECIES: hypothetical protein [Chromobacterium]|uniref:hypothetical protein n=1 Tax=Chromobacterium TaxID=535 RepID=UPI001887BC90|nr:MULTISPECIES: hypothetical protein [Chromobacterium]QOZ84828.1 hypothetical protein DXT74_18095 [Chromobacterium sp. Rain0013]WON85024.1 hypothetical protein OK026_05830 [Chromobacterium haemolyticum]